MSSPGSGIMQSEISYVVKNSIGTEASVVAGGFKLVSLEMSKSGRTD